MSRNLLDQDFGSEEEDDDFNPAPADVSDDEGARQTKVRLNKPVATLMLTQRTQTSNRGHDDDDADDADSKSERAGGHRRGSDDVREADDDDAEDGEPAGAHDEGDNDDEEEGEGEEEEIDEEEEDEDDEDANTVSAVPDALLRL